MASILSFLGFGKEDSTDSEAIARIAQALDRLDERRARYIAAFAFVLSRLAAADHDVADEEAASIERMVREKGGLPADQAALVVEMATREQRVFGATDDFLVTRELQRDASYDERLQLVECLFAVAAIEGSISMAEETEIHRILNQLKIQPTDLTALRVAHRSHLPGIRPA